MDGYEKNDGGYEYQGDSPSSPHRVNLRGPMR